MTLNFMKITVIGNYVFNTLFSLNQGTGMYIYIETSSPRQPGDTARLESPWMRGPQCMTFFYHMYGARMSRVVIYIHKKPDYQQVKTSLGKVSRSGRPLEKREHKHQRDFKLSSES